MQRPAALTGRSLSPAQLQRAPPVCSPCPLHPELPTEPILPENATASSAAAADEELRKQQYMLL